MGIGEVIWCIIDPTHCHNFWIIASLTVGCTITLTFGNGFIEIISDPGLFIGSAPVIASSFAYDSIYSVIGITSNIAYYPVDLHSAGVGS